MISINTLEKCLEFFDAGTLFKLFSSGDIALITPWVNLNSPVTIRFQHKDETCFKSFEAGHLALCLKESSDHVLIFLVCGGLDEEDNIPQWAWKFKAQDLLGIITSLISA